MLILNLTSHSRAESHGSHSNGVDSNVAPSAHVERRWIQFDQAIVVGRSTHHSEWPIVHDPLLSKRHFRIECGGQSSQLIDLGSTNGTFLNGTKVDQATIYDGDLIVAGNSAFQIELPSQVRPVDHPSATLDEKPVDETPASVSSPITPFDLPFEANPSHAVGEQTSFTGTRVEIGDELEQESQLPTWMTAKAKDFDGWETETDAWGEDDPPVIAPVAEVAPTIVAPGVRPSFETDRTSATIAIHNDEDISFNALVSRSVAWIGSGQCFVVGRSRQFSDMAIATDNFLSSRHFQITVEHGRCTVTNVSETNGTWLNGNKVQTALLRDGDIITAGQTQFIIGVDSPEPVSDLQFRATMVLAKD